MVATRTDRVGWLSAVQPFGRKINTKPIRMVRWSPWLMAPNEYLNDRNSRSEKDDHDARPAVCAGHEPDQAADQVEPENRPDAGLGVGEAQPEDRPAGLQADRREVLRPLPDRLGRKVEDQRVVGVDERPRPVETGDRDRIEGVGDARWSAEQRAQAVEARARCRHRRRAGPTARAGARALTGRADC